VSLVRWLLARILPSTGDGRSILGDILEEYDRRPSGPGRLLWIAGVSVDLTIRYLPHRLGMTLASVARDLNYAARLGRRAPALALATVLSLGCAIAISTAAFSVANTVWLRRTLAADPSVVRVYRRFANGASWGWPETELAQLRAGARVIQIEAIAMSEEQVEWPADASAASQDTAVGFVTGGYLSMLHASARVGRLLTDADDRTGAGLNVVLDAGYWRAHFAAAPDVVGRVITIRGVPFTIVGVVDPDFVDPASRKPWLWASLASMPRLPAVVANGVSTPVRPLAIGRLGSGATMAAADAELSRLAEAIAPAPGVPRLTSGETAPTISGTEIATDRRILAGVGAIILLVLVLACANVSNLLLAGVASRRREIVIRLACGARRARVLQQLMTESALLGVSAGAAGLLAARWIAPALAIGMSAPGADVTPDPRVYVFVAIATTLSALGVGLAPAWAGARSDVSSATQGARLRVTHDSGSSRSRSIFVGVQTAASIVLVTLAMLQVRALVHLAWLDPGIDVEHLVLVNSPLVARLPGESVRAAAFWPQAIEEVRAIPGVERASLASITPFGMTYGGAREKARSDWTDADYFSTVGLRVVRGRTYTESEVASHEKVAVISAQLAHRYWADQDALGGNLGRVDGVFDGVHVIGVVNDAMFDRVDGPRVPMVFLPLGVGGSSIAIRTRTPDAVGRIALQSLRKLSPQMQPSVTLAADLYRRAFETPRRYATLAASVAVFALVLSVVGLCGITAYAVRTRTREIGVRKALGASNGDVIALLMRQALRPVVAGLAVGFIGALVAGHAMANVLYGLSDRDPLALCAAIAIFLATASLAVAVPARRVIGFDPAVTLRDT
jgi:predicted permease